VIEAQDAEFDPASHEAVGQLEREGVEAGVVIEVVQQGYRLGDMLLRPARVIISS
jgi:molecular chaperone GrpE